MNPFHPLRKSVLSLSLPVIAPPCAPVGSRSFNGSTDRIDWSAIWNPTAQPLTISAWVNSDGVAGNPDYIFEVHSGGDSAIGLTLYQYSATGVGFTRRGTTVLFKGALAPGSLTGAWHHILVTHDGTDTDYTTIHIYFDGAEGTTDTGPTNGVSVVAQTGSWSIGGRIFDDGRNYDGKIAQVAAWSRVLNSTEIANLALGQAPSLAAPGDLQFYWKGNTGSLKDQVTSAFGAADGTSQLTGAGNGPSITYET
jgi:hypothetical protein